MNKERLVRYGAEIAVGYLTLQLLLNAFTHKQRDAIVFGRDEGKCQATFRHRCNQRQFPLELDHIIPQRYAKEMGIPDVDTPENAITKCRAAHDMKHPDRVKARQEWHGSNGTSFNNMFNDRHDKLEHRKIYWNPEHDREDSVVALRRTQKARAKGWVFPESGSKK